MNLIVRRIHNRSVHIKLLFVRSLALFLLLAPSLPASAPISGARLVHDINQTITQTAGSFPTELLTIGATTYFVADDGNNGRELWRTDGTPSGTTWVTDLILGAGGVLGPTNLTNVNGHLFFVFDTSLYTSDGTRAGTVLLKTFSMSGGYSLTNLTPAGSTLYFIASDGSLGRELWKSDGTRSGTVMVKDIRPGAEGAFSPGGNPYLTDVNGVLFFAANDGTNQMRLWKSDGTSAGTTIVNPATPVSPFGFSPTWLTAFKGKLFFSADDGTHGQELWQSDGTSPGTVMVTDLADGMIFPTNLVAVGETLYFHGSSASVRRLWKSDGTPAGTVVVSENVVIDTTVSVTSSELVPVGTTIFFVGNNGTGPQVWKSDGSAQGTVLVRDATPGIGFPPYALQSVHGALYLQILVPAYGIELWRSDGTPAGTHMVKDINPRPGYGCECSLVAPGPNGTILFGADDGAHGRELWRSDGTEAGTTLLNDINLGVGSSSPLFLTDVKGTLFFVASDGITAGAMLWKSAGLATSAALVKAVYPSSLANLNGTLFFSGNTAGSDRELWKSDGTAEGTVRVKDINPNGSSDPSSMIDVAGTLFFTALSDPSHQGLWKSDGTPEGTVLVKPIDSGYIPPGRMAALGSTLFFGKDDGFGKQELWKSDGTPDGTLRVKDINLGGQTGIASLVVVGDTLFFTAYTDAAGTELWKSDGTPEGTTMVKDILPDVASSLPTSLTNFDGVLLFTITNAANGTELWKSDGTPEGTVPIKTFAAVNGFAPFVSLVNASGRLFLLVSPVNGQTELWTSDGTPAGTIHVTQPPILGGLTPFGDQRAVLFTGYDESTGLEVWTSDGTAAGTHILADIAPGARSSSPEYYTNVGSSVFFRANDNVHGLELWALAPSLQSVYLPAVRISTSR